VCLSSWCAAGGRRPPAAPGGEEKWHREGSGVIWEPFLLLARVCEGNLDVE